MKMWKEHSSGLYMVANIICDRIPSSDRFYAYKNLETGKISITINNTHYCNAVEINGKLECTRHNDTFSFV